MVNTKEKGVKKLKGRYNEIVGLEEVSLPFAYKVSLPDTVKQIPEGCKQLFKALEFQASTSIRTVVNRVNTELGYEAYIIVQKPGTHGTEYYIAHKRPSDTSEAGEGVSC